MVFNSPLNLLYSPVRMDNYFPMSVYIVDQKSHRPINSLFISKCCIVDVNHGEGDYIWTLISFSYLSSIRNIIMKSTNIDILKTPVLPDNNLLMLNKIPIKKIVQKQGSSIFINSGMLFWG